jgi:hypothetical protein
VAIAADGCITLPDGQLRAVLAVTPVNFDCRSHPEQDALAAHFAALACALAPGQTVQVVVESRPSDAAAILPQLLAHLTPRTAALAEFVDAYRPWVTRQIARAHVPDLRYYLVISPVPTRAELGTRQSSRRLKRRSAGRDRRALEQAVDEVRRHLTRMNLDSRQLSRPEALRVLWDGLHPPDHPCPPEVAFGSGADVDEDTPSMIPGRPAPSGIHWRLARWPRRAEDAIPAERVAAWWLQRLLCAIALEEAHTHLQLEGSRATSRLCRSLFLLAPPEVTDPGWLDPLIGLDCPFRLALHLEGLDRKAERRRLKRRRRSLNVITLGTAQAGGVADVDMESAQAEARQQALDTLDPARAILRLGLYLTVFADDEDQLADHVERALSLLTSQLGAEVGRGIGHQLPLWQATLPLGLDPAQRRYRVRSETVGNAFPFLTHNPGMRAGILLGFTAVNHELVLFNPIDPSLNNGLINLLGKTGSGKTQTAQKLAFHVLLAGGRVMVVDKAGHYETLLAVVGGTAVRLGAPDPPAINLWDGEFSPERVHFVVDAHEVLLATTPGQCLDARARALLSDGVRAVYRSAAGRMPLERELVTWLHAETLRRHGPERDLLQQLATTLSAYVGDGEYAELLDRPTSVDLEASLLVFDLEGVAQRLQPLAMFLIAGHLRRRAMGRQQRPDENLRELLIVDEGWYIIRYAAAAHWIDELARKGRHWGIGIIFITQQLSDLIKDPVAAGMFNAASVQVLFRQRDAQTEGESPVAWLRDKLGLSMEEADRLYSLTSVPGEYTEALLVRESKDSVQPRRGVVQVVCHPLEYWLFTSEPWREVPYRQRMASRPWAGTCGPRSRRVRRARRCLKLPPPCCRQRPWERSTRCRTWRWSHERRSHRDPTSVCCWPCGADQPAVRLPCRRQPAQRSTGPCRLQTDADASVYTDGRGWAADQHALLLQRRDHRPAHGHPITQPNSNRYAESTCDTDAGAYLWAALLSPLPVPARAERRLPGLADPSALALLSHLHSLAAVGRRPAAEHGHRPWRLGAGHL